MNDTEIVELYWQRSEEAIYETSEKYGNYCYAIANCILCNHEDAEESVNDTYRDAWNSMPPHRPSVLSTFLGKITRRISIDRYRKRKAEKRGGGEFPLILDELADCITDGESIEDEYEKKCLAEAINTFVKSLSETERKIFLCRYWHMEPISEIGKRFGFSESKVKSMLYRTREKLRKVLEKEGMM